MVRHILDNLKMESTREKECFFTIIFLFMKEILVQISFTDMENIIGKMVKNFKAITNKEKSTAKVSFL